METSNSQFQRQVKKFYRLTVYARWLFILFCWLTLGTYAIWGLRHEISLWFDYFTWSAVRYGLMFNIIPAICLIFCIGITVSVLVWQSRNIIWGLPSQEKQQLEKQVERILVAGNKHPLWKWLN
jgi:uncharacterized Tic20 family protein